MISTVTEYQVTSSVSKTIFNFGGFELVVKTFHSPFGSPDMPHGVKFSEETKIRYFYSEIARDTYLYHQARRWERDVENGLDELYADYAQEQEDYRTMGYPV